MSKILLITADQWRADCLGFLGHPCLRTPNLDRLAAEGVSFTRHYAQCAPCGPSRASLHTGTYLMTHRSARNGTPLAPHLTNVALELRKAGYRPKLIGYTDTSVDPRDREPGDPALHTYAGVLPGFDQLVPHSEGPVAWIDHLRTKGFEFQRATHPEDEPDVFDPDPGFPDVDARGPTFAPARYPAELSDTAFSIDHAIRFVTEQAGDDWCLHLSLLRPHPPFIAPAPYHAMYAPEDGPPFLRQETPDREGSVHPFIDYGMTLTAKWLAKRDYDMSDERHQRQLRATYWGMISEVDHHLGRLFDALRESGDYEDTLIVFTTDHGEQLLDHWWLGKECCFEQSFHIPLIVRAPDMPSTVRGRRIDRFTESVDILPTLCAFAGLPAPAQCDGESLMPWLEGDTPPRWRRFAFYELDFRDIVERTSEDFFGVDLESCNFAALRGERFKYLHFPALPPLLFDLDSDPGELRNLAGDPSNTTVLLDCAQTMLSHRMRHAERTMSGQLLTREHGLVVVDENRRHAR